MAMRKTISVLVVCIVSVLIDNVVSENRGNCDIKEFESSDWYFGYANSERINDDHGSNVIIEFNTENIRNATIKKDEKFSKYFEVTLENDKLIISTSSLFDKYEDSESEIEPEFEVQLSCVRDNADFIFKQPINDINNHRPEFQNQTYEYTLPMPWPPEFEITNYGPIIVTDDDITNRRVTFGIEDNEYILIGNLKSSENQKQHWASLKPKQHLSLQEDLQLRISAQDEGNPPLIEYSTVIIKKNVIQSVQQDPRFSEVLYKGTYSDSHELTLGKMEIEMDTYVPEITVELNGDLKDHFSLRRNENQIEIVLKTNLDEELWDKSAYILLFLEATNTKAVHTGRTAILIDLPVKEITTTTECPATTECPTTTELETTTECVTVTCPECPTECPATTECPTTTELETTTECVTVTCPECPTECPTTTECPSTTELETTTECVTVSCPECPTVCPETTTVPSKPGDLQFVPKDDVVITKNANFTGELLVVHTTIDPAEKVTYEVSASEYISQRVTIDPNSGSITVLSPLLPTTHRFKIIATSEKSQQTATKNIELNIKPDGTSETSHSLLIIPGVKENKDHPGIVPKYEGNCVYVIVDQQPNAETYCKVNPATKSIDCKDIDRESKQFAQMNDAAQIQLKLVLDCEKTNLGLDRLIETHLKQNISVKPYSNHYDSDSLRLVNRDPNDDSAYWIRTDSIANNVAEMYVNILIEDDNDNAPKFQMGRNPVVVGYPKKDLIDAVQPKSVITIKATDADIYPNNIIKYELRGTELFTIHPDSGVIYPQRTMGDVSETVSFQVVASDHENESQYDTLDVKVHMLSTEHISVLNINSGTLENVDAIMESINKEADKIDIYYLSAAVIPKDSDDNSRASRVKRDAAVKENEPDSVTVLRLIVYALDDTTFTPIDSDELFEILKDIEPNNESWSVGDMNPLSNIITYEKDLTGYIVAVSLLSVLLAFVLCGTGAIYYFVIRPRLYDDFSNENSYNSENGDPDNIDVDSPDYKEKCDSNWALSLEEENIYSTGTDIRNPASETIEPWNEKQERKKSVVTFKEMVEEIEIEHM